MPPLSRRNASGNGPPPAPTNRTARASGATRRTGGLDPGIQIRTANSYGDPSPPLPRPTASGAARGFADVIRTLDPEPIRARPESGRAGALNIRYTPDPNRTYGDESSINRRAGFDDSSVLEHSSDEEDFGSDGSDGESIEEEVITKPPVRQSSRLSTKKPSPPTRELKPQNSPIRPSSQTGTSSTTRVSPPNRGSRRGSEAVEAVEAPKPRGSRRGNERGSNETVVSTARESHRGNEVVEPITNRGSRRGSERGSDANVRGSPKGSSTKSESLRKQEQEQEQGHDGATFYDLIVDYIEWIYLNVKEFISTIFSTILSATRSTIEKTHAAISWTYQNISSSLKSAVVDIHQGFHRFFAQWIVRPGQWLWDQVPSGLLKTIFSWFLSMLLFVIYGLAFLLVLNGLFRVLEEGSKFLSPTSSSMPYQSEPHNWNIGGRLSKLNPFPGIKDRFSDFLPLWGSKEFGFTGPQNEELVDTALADLPEYVAVKVGKDGRTTLPNELWTAINDKTRAVDSSDSANSGFGSSGKNSAPIWDKFVSDNAKRISSIQSASSEFKRKHPKYFEANRLVPKEDIISMVRQIYKYQQPSMGPELKKLAARLEKAEKELQRMKKSGGISEDRARELVSDGISHMLSSGQLEALAKHLMRGNVNFGMTRINHWSLGTGAVVDLQLTSPNYVFPYMKRAWFKKQLRWMINNPVPTPNPPTAALERWDEHGDCWCSPADDREGYGPTIGVLSSNYFYPDQVVVEHIAGSASIAPGATPKHMELLAYIEDFNAYDSVMEVSNNFFNNGHDVPSKHEFHYIKIATWTYDARGEVAQAFSVQVDLKQFSVPVNKLVIRAKDNWGDNIPYTCLYRVRVHGDIHPEDLVKSRGIKEDQDWD